MCLPCVLPCHRYLLHHHSVAIICDMKCSNCKKDVAVDATIYRLGTSWALTWSAQWRSTIGSLCEDCIDLPSVRSCFGFKQFNDPVPCACCGRPVKWDASRMRRKYTVCSKECQTNVYKSLRPNKPLTTNSCAVCGEPFTAKRQDARFCSPRCRQRAARNRLKSAPSARG